LKSKRDLFRSKLGGAHDGRMLAGRKKEVTIARLGRLGAEKEELRELKDTLTQVLEKGGKGGLLRKQPTGEGCSKKRDGSLTNCWRREKGLAKPTRGSLCLEKKTKITKGQTGD